MLSNSFLVLVWVTLDVLRYALTCNDLYTVCVHAHHLCVLHASCAGFSRLRMLAKQPGGAQAPVAFIEFHDIQSAANAMASLQGTFLLSSDRGAIRIEYAKSKMAATEGAAYHNGWHHLANLEVCLHNFIDNYLFHLQFLLHFLPRSGFVVAKPVPLMIKLGQWG